MLDQPLRAWPLLGAVPLTDWSPAREEVHVACQLLASFGRTHVPPRTDHGHEALWVRPGGKVVTTALGAGPRPLRAALSLREMVLLVLGEDEVLHDGLPLPGRTQEEAREWLEATVARLGGGEAPLEAPSHPAPSHPLLDGGARYAEQGEEARIELGRLFAAGQDALGAVQRGRPDWGPLRLWPHHFDLATLRPLDPDGGQEARSIGAGLAPGGPGEEPYLYVLPWPPPADDAALRAGRWTREGFVGARLDLGQVLEAHPLERGEQVEEFLEGAIAACEELLGA